MTSCGHGVIRTSSAFFALFAIFLLAGCPVNFYGTLDKGTGISGQTGAGTGQTIVLTILPSQVTLSPNSTMTFSAIGGVPPYAYSVVSGGGSFSGTVFTASGAAGTTTVQVTDSAAGKSFASVTTVSMLSISPTSVSVYTTSTFTFTASGGTPPYSYSITSGGGSLSGPGNATYTAPGSAGSATVQVTDSALSTSSASISILTHPAALSITPATVSLQVNGSITFSASGGVPPYTYVQTAGSGTLIGATYTAPPATGSANVQVRDAVLSTATATITITAATGVLAISPAAAQLGAFSSITFSATGGTPPYSYAVAAGAGTINAVTGVYTAPASGTDTVQVTDSASPTPATSSATVNVVPPPLTIVPGATYVPINGGMSFTASGGTGSGYVFSMASGSGSITAGGIYSAPSAPGSASIKVTDSGSNTATASITIYNPFAIVPPSVTVTTSTQYTFTAAGGVPPYSFSMVSGPGSIDSATGVYSAPSAPASGILVRASDSIGNTSTSSVTVVPPVIWTIMTPGLGGKPGPYSSLALDSSGLPMVAYYDGLAQGSLKFTSDFAAPVAADGTRQTGKYVSLALDASSNPRVSYYDANLKTLRYNSASGSTWAAPQIADNGGGTDDVGQYCSIALDSSGLAHISYYNATKKVLMYVVQTGLASWATAQIVDNGSGGTHDVGQYSSIALDGSGLAHISYYDNTAHVLKYVTQTGPATWVFQTVDTDGDVGKFSSLALDSAGLGRISYYDATLGHLKYARQTGPSSWTVIVVDSAGNVGQYSSIALDSSGDPRIAYYDVTNSNLKCAFSADPAGSIWDLETADTGGTSLVGTYTSIKLGPSTGKARITYFDASATTLKYAAQQ